MSRRALRARFLVAAVLALATLSLFLGAGRFVLSGPELLPEAARLAVEGPGQVPGWQALGQVAPAGAEGLHLRNRDPAGQAALFRRVAVPQGVDHLALSAEIRLQDVAGGREPWHRARVILPVREAGAGEDGWRYDLPHTVMRAGGSAGWQYFRRIFAVPKAGEAMVTVQLLRATGDLWLRGLSLRPALEKPWFPYAAGLLQGLWLLAAGWILWPLLARLAAALARGRPRWADLLLAATLAAALAIAAGVLVPPAAKQVLHDAAVLLWNGAAAPQPATLAADPSPGAAAPAASAPASSAEASARGFVAPGQLVWLAADKLGHFGGFAMLALLALAAARAAPGWSRRRTALTGAALLGFAALTETWQVMAEARGASVLDVAIDAAGLAAGALLWLGLQALLRLRRNGAIGGG